MILPATFYPLTATRHPLPATGYPLPVTRYPLPATHHHHHHKNHQSAAVHNESADHHYHPLHDVQCMDQLIITCLFRLNTTKTTHLLVSQYSSIKQGEGRGSYSMGSTYFKLWRQEGLFSKEGTYLRGGTNSRIFSILKLFICDTRRLVMNYK